MKKYIFVNTQIDQLLDPKIGLFKDLFLCNKYDIVCRSVFKNYKSNIINFIVRIIFINRLNFLFWPIKRLLYTFDKIEFDQNSQVYFIIPTMSLTKIYINYLENLKIKNANFKFILFMIKINKYVYRGEY